MPLVEQTGYSSGATMFATGFKSGTCWSWFPIICLDVFNSIYLLFVFNYIYWCPKPFAFQVMFFSFNGMPLVQQELLILPGHFSSPRFFMTIRLTQSIECFVDYFVFLLLLITVLSVLITLLEFPQYPSTIRSTTTATSRA